MTDFKVGDKAEIRTGIEAPWEGAAVTVTETNRRATGGSFDVRVERADGQTALFDYRELKLVQPKHKFKVGDTVTFCMAGFDGWQGGEGIVRSLPTYARQYYKVEIVTPPPTNNAQRPGNRVDLLEEWLAVPPAPKLKALADYAVADVKATQAIFEAVKPLKIYLAGPMSGIEHYNFPAFFTAARKLRKAGHTVFNPAENDLATGFNALGMEGHEAADHGFSLRDALKTDLSWICENADALVLLDGWEGSKGVRAEMALAEALGLPKYEMAKLPVAVAK